MQVQELRKRAEQLPDDYLVVFVGELPAATSSCPFPPPSPEAQNRSVGPLLAALGLP
jgi:hypothetical protein